MERELSGFSVPWHLCDLVVDGSHFECQPFFFRGGFLALFPSFWYGQFLAFYPFIGFPPFLLVLDKRPMALLALEFFFSFLFSPPFVPLRRGPHWPGSFFFVFWGEPELSFSLFFTVKPCLCVPSGSQTVVVKFFSSKF